MAQNGPGKTSFSPPSPPMAARKTDEGKERKEETALSRNELGRSGG